MATRTISLPAICPPEETERQSCGKCLSDRLRNTPGVRNVDLQVAEGESNAVLTLDYDPRYGKTTGFWTTDMFVEAVYKSLAREKEGAGQ